MKSKYTLLLPLSFALLYASCKSKNESFDSLSQLEGSWSMKFDQSEVMESWQKINDTLMEGKSFEITGADTVLSETVQLISNGDGVFYIPTVKDQNNEQPVSFKLSSHEGNKFVFENPKHDFPTSITYDFLEGNKLKATISGVVRDEVRSLDFDYVKVK